MRLQIRFKQLFPGPKRAFRHGFIFIGCKLVEQRQKLQLGAIANGDGSVAAQTGSFCPTDGRSAKCLAELSRAHFGERLERWIYQLRTRVGFRRGGYWSFTVPGADVLADVASENVLANARPQFLGNRSTFLNREIGNALDGIELVGSDEGGGRTSFDTPGAAPTAAGTIQARPNAKEPTNQPS